MGCIVRDEAEFGSMGTIEVLLDGDPHAVETDDLLECRDCGTEWIDLETPPECPECRTTDAVEPVGEIIFQYPKDVWRGAESIEEMRECLLQRAAILDELDAAGWRLMEPPAAAHAYLVHRSADG